VSQLPLAPQQWRSPRGCRRNVNETTTPKLPPVKAAVDEGSWRLAPQVMAHFDTLKESIMGIENTWNNCIHNYQILPKCGEHGKIIYEWVDFPLPCLLERKDNDYQPSDPCFSFPSTWLAKATRCNQDGHPNIDSSCQIDPSSHTLWPSNCRKICLHHEWPRRVLGGARSHWLSPTRRWPTPIPLPPGDGNQNRHVVKSARHGSSDVVRPLLENMEKRWNHFFL
jgi:hypothetical protein